MEYVPLKGFDDYEIMTSYPYDIKNKSTNGKCGMIYSKNDGILININGMISPFSLIFLIVSIRLIGLAFPAQQLISSSFYTNVENII